MVKYNKRYSLAALAAVAFVGAGYLVYKTFPHLTESESEEKVDVETLNDEELKQWLLKVSIH